VVSALFAIGMFSFKTCEASTAASERAESLGDCSGDANAQPDYSGAFAPEGTIRPLERMSMHLAGVFRTNTDLIR
jgi:hypothetical protein